MKPERLYTDPNSEDATKQWKHWLRTFKNYLTSLDQARSEADPAVDKLRVLANNVDYKVFTTSKTALRTLQQLHC